MAENEFNPKNDIQMKKFLIFFALILTTVTGFAQYEHLINYWYGIEFSTTASDPNVTRIAESDSLRCHIATVLPVHVLMKGCVLKDDGTVNYYLNPTDWSKKASGAASDLDGDDGQVMIEIPAHWERFETDGNTRRVKISLTYKSGFMYVPTIYVGAYKAALNRTTLKLSSVKNTTTTYRGGNNNATYDGTDKTFLGKPATNITKTNFRTYAQNRGPNWSMLSYTAWKKVFWLCAIEYATLNSQKAIDATFTAEGYAKGGLGAGVTNLVGGEWNTYNGYYPVIPCGTSDSLANKSGEKAYTIPGYTGTSAVKVPRYRGIESPFGDIWEWVDGIQIHHLQTQQTSKAYISENPNYFADNGANLGRVRSVHNISKTSGYIKTMAFGAYGDIVPADAGSSGTGSSTYYCDYYYSGYAGATWGWRALIVGGAADAGSDVGLGYASSYYAASLAIASIGSRLCYTVPVEANLVANASGLYPSVWHDYDHAVTGTVSGATAVIPTGSNLGGVYFNGTDSHLTKTGMPGIAGNLTVVGWFYPIGYGESNAGRVFDNSKAMLYTNSSGYMSFSRDGSTAINSGAASIALNKRIFVAVASTSAGVTNFYVGDEDTAPVLSGTANQAAGTPAAGTTWYIGNRAAGDRTFHGNINSLTVYQRILTTDEILNEYQTKRY